MGNMFRCTLKSGGASGTGIPLIVTCSEDFAGKTITATDGTTTLTETCPSASPYTVQFDLPNTGTWTISGTYSGTTYTDVVTITPYTATLNAIPDGSTATPTDVIQTWLHCAGIFDKAYTTIAQVLNDSTTVTALIASTNAVDYMARSTTWASSVCANSSAMTKIGANNYCADALLSNSTWLNAICGSTYFESVLNVKVPTMTSNTTPSGVASASSVSGSNDAFHAFDNVSGNRWASSGVPPANLNYKFTQNVKVYKVSFRPFYGGGQTVKDYQIESKVNGSWVSEKSGTTENVDYTNPIDVVITSPNASDEHRIYVSSSHTNSFNYVSIHSLQFYGRAVS